MRLTVADIEAERGEFEPFEIELDEDNVIALPHPDQLPSDVLLTIGAASSPEEFAAVILTQNPDFQKFLNREGGQIGDVNFVIGQYTRHFGLGTPGEGSASRRSSSGSARPSKSTSRNKGKNS